MCKWLDICVCALCSKSAQSFSQSHRRFDLQPKSTTLAGLVDCLVKIGGVADAQATLHQSLPNQVVLRLHRYAVTLLSLQSVCTPTSCVVITVCVWMIPSAPPLQHAHALQCLCEQQAQQGRT